LSYRRVLKVLFWSSRHGQVYSYGLQNQRA